MITAKTMPTPIQQVTAEIAADLGRSSMELLGYPEVAMRVQRALSDDNVSAQQLVKVVGAEPVLTSRILCLANSVALNPRGEATTDLRLALARMGMDTFRSAVMSYAMGQVRASRELASIAAPLRELWQTSVLVGALCAAIARHHGKVDPDAALLAGLLHGVGKLYILIKLSRYPELLADATALPELICDWHSTIGRSLVEQWQLPAPIAEAVGEYEYFDDSSKTPEVELTEVLYLSTVLIELMQDPEQLESLMVSHRALTRFGMSAADCRRLVAESERYIVELEDSLGM